MGRRISETVLHAVFSPGVEDAHGNKADGWASAVPRGVWAFDPGGSVETFPSGHDRIITTPSLLAPEAGTFGGRDRVTARGVLYEVDGDPQVWRHPSGRFAGVVVNLKKVSG